MRTIYLPAIDKSVTISAYVAAIKKAKANPDAEFKHGLTVWWPCTGQAIVRQFRQGLNDRITAADPYWRRGYGPMISFQPVGDAPRGELR